MNKGEHLDITRLVPAVREHLVPILDDALSLCAERHLVGVGRGVDMFSFGTDAWSIPAHQFRAKCQDGSIPFELTGEPGCVLDHQGVRIRHHRVGLSEADDISVSFPRNAGAAGRESSKQMVLPLDGFAPIDPPGTVVLAYMANPDDGLCAVYLATVGRVERGAICEWDAVEAVWSRDLITVTSTEPADVVATEETPTPIVRRREKRATDVAGD